MKSRWIASLTFATVASLSTPLQGGWIIGNGGDPVRLAFQNAKNHLAHVLSKLTPLALQDEAQDVRDWFAANAADLAADMASSRLRFYEEPKVTCASTGLQRNAEIHLSIPTCRQSIKSYHEAGLLLIHEVVHHFGFVHDEEHDDFPDRVATAIMNAWENGFHEWSNIQDSPSPGNAHSSAIWSNGKIYTFGGVNSTRRYEVHGDLWQFELAGNEWTKISSHEPRFGHSSVLYKDKLIVWGGFKYTSAGRNTQTRWMSTGAIYNFTTKAWTELSLPGTQEPHSVRPSPHQKAQSIVLVGDLLFVYGSRPNSSAAGYILNLKTMSWSSAIAGGPDVMQGHTVNAIGNEQIMVWGGLGANLRPLNSGAIYNLNTKRWKDISTTGAPRQIADGTAVWTGDKLVLFGVNNSSWNLKGIGGVYTPATDSWIQFESDVAFGRFGHSMLWTGKDVIIFGGRTKRLSGTFLNSTIKFNPSTQQFSSSTSRNSPAGRAFHASVWTGSQVIILGGADRSGATFDSGAIYTP